jgi:hypothetical protein
MIIRNVYSKTRENVTLECDVEIDAENVDRTSHEYLKIVERLFDGYGEGDQEIQNLASDLAEIKRFVEWADSYLDQSENAFFEKADCAHEEGCDCGENWWNYMCSNADAWPSWKKYNTED